MRQTLFFIAFIVATLAFAPICQAASVGKVAAVVNGEMITMYDLEQFCAPELMQKKLNPKNPAQRKEVDAILRQGLDMMTMDLLLAQEAEKLKINVSDIEVEEEFQRSVKRRNVSEEVFLAQVKREGFTKAMVKDRIKKGILRQKLMGMMVGRKVVVTPEEVKAYFEAHKSELSQEKNPRMALLVYPDNVDANSWAKRIKSGSVSFEDAVRQTSIGPNKAGGGDVGPLKWKELNPAWQQKLSSMQPGEVSPVFIVEGKKAQLKLITMGNNRGDIKLEDVTPEIENILREPRLQERFKEYSEQTRKKAVIDVRF